MPKSRDLQDEMYAYTLALFKKRYEEQMANKITHTKTNVEKYPKLENVVDFVFKQGEYYESNSGEIKRFGQKEVSRGTVRKAVHRLIDEGKIEPRDGSYEYKPKMDVSLSEHPILDIAEKIDVSIGVPSDMIVLSVAPEYCASIAKYLSAIFYKGDIIFIPLGAQILCISVFPESILDGSDKQPLKVPYGVRERVELALHKFNVCYPNFTYGFNYEQAYHVTHNDDIIEPIAKSAKQFEKDYPYLERPELFKSIQEGICKVSEFNAVAVYSEEDLTDACDEDKITQLPTELEWYAMFDTVDEEFKDEEEETKEEKETEEENS